MQVYGYEVRLLLGRLISTGVCFWFGDGALLDDGVDCRAKEGFGFGIWVSWVLGGRFT